MNAYESDFTCGCGKSFAQQSALSNHRRKCINAKRKLSNLLSRAREVWEENEKRKRQKMPDNAPPELERRDCEDNPPPREADSDTLTSVPPSSGNDTTSPDHPSVEMNSDGGATCRRSGRIPKPSSRLRDYLPHAAIDWGDKPTGGSTAQDGSRSNSSQNPGQTDSKPRQNPIFCTMRDAFGVFRQYYCPFPPYDPDIDSSINIISDIGMEESSNHHQEKPSSPPLLKYDPYPNKSTFLLAEWYWRGSGRKSRRDFKSLIDILRNGEFNIEEVQSASWTKLDRKLVARCISSSDVDAMDDAGALSSEAGWKKEEVTILVPFHSRQSTSGPQEYFAGHFFRKSICAVIREKLASPSIKGFHFEPYSLFVHPHPDRPGSTPSRVYGELYNSPAFINAHFDIQHSTPINKSCPLPRYVAALMFAMDETHLTQFGETKLWPLYLQFGNESKYKRCRPSQELCQHVAYLISPDDDIEDFIRLHTRRRNPTDKLLAHCSREMLHGQWKLILDDEFVEAYSHGMVIKCFDGVERRIFPRIFTLIADYKEKVSLAGIKSLGTHPCPRCLTELDDVPEMGSIEDRERRLTSSRQDNPAYRKALKTARMAAYKQGYSVAGDTVMEHLSHLSVQPAENAFSLRLSKYGFDVFKALPIDLMHEIESGTWKSLFKHILRILFCEAKSCVFDLNHRFRQVPTFGLDTIRRFRRNISSMRNLAAHDWEDILQCSMPVLDGLLPEPHNTHVMDCLFLFGLWHGLAKLRMQTDASLIFLDQTTSTLGDCLRTFQATTCAYYKTTELPKDMYETSRKKKKAATSSQTSNKKPHPPPTKGPGLPDSGAIEVENASSSARLEETPTGTKKTKKFNLKTYKFHAMGDYVSTIKELGTTDSFSTEVGELEHRRSKARYARTNKKDFISQIARVEQRQSRLKRIRQNLLTQLQPKDREDMKADLEESQSPTARYHVSKAYSSSELIPRFLQQHAGDPATKNFLDALKLHVLTRIMRIHHLPQDVSIFFEHERMYHHKVVRFNYTTYDLRRAQDSVNPLTTQCNIMMLSDSAAPTGHQYLYARVIDIFHVNAVCTGIGTTSTTTRLDVLWVRWYDHRPPTAQRRLDRLSFPPVDSPDAFGFVDPSDVLRAMHAIPSFHAGRRYDAQADDAPSPLAAQKRDEWCEYSVNRFVDRDMLMRYHPGLGIGHRFCSQESETWQTAPFNPADHPGMTVNNEYPGSTSKALESLERHTGQLVDSNGDPKIMESDGNHTSDGVSSEEEDEGCGGDCSTTDDGSDSDEAALDDDGSSVDSIELQENQLLYPSTLGS